MTLEKMVSILRLNLSDEQKVGWPEDSELVAYLDRAASFLSDRLIAEQDSGLMKKLVIKGKTQLPEDFVKFVGSVPVRIIGKECESYGVFAVNPGAMRWENPNIADDRDGPVWERLGQSPEKTWDELTTTSDMTALYWSRLPFPSAFEFDAPLPYTQEQGTLIVDIGRIFALNKNEYDISQDMTLTAEIQKAMSAARGRAQ